MYQKPKIGQIELDGWAALAPMAGVSDLAYRVIARRMGAAMTTAEMVSAKGLYYKNEKTRDMLKIDPGEHPVALQLFGSEPDIMALGAKEMEKAGADIIDINMGCPMQKVVKNGDGSALMKNIPLAAEVVKAMAGGPHTGDRENATGLVQRDGKLRRTGRSSGGGRRYGDYRPWTDQGRFLHRSCGLGKNRRSGQGCSYSCLWKRRRGGWAQCGSADERDRLCWCGYRPGGLGESLGL